MEYLRHIGKADKTKRPPEDPSSGGRPWPAPPGPLAGKFVARIISDCHFL
jgi:hypothetical protein